MPDDLSATLAGIRDDNIDSYADGSTSDIPRLVAAFEAVLKLPEDWQRETARLDKLASTEADPQSRIAISMRAQAFEECARALREAITAELATLTGEGS